jgi:hypothetical protein
MLSRLVDLLFGCSHANYSFPQTTKSIRVGTGVVGEPRTYVACLECGKDLPYDWHKMRVLFPEKKAA